MLCPRLPRDAQLQKDFKGFQPNMLVTFDLHNIDATKRLQEGHGGWNSDMGPLTPILFSLGI